MSETNGNIERLLIDLKENLEREIAGLGSEMREGFSRIETRFDNQSARMERHAALLQTGSRWTMRMNEWAEKMDSALDVKDRQIADLTERVRKLETNPPSTSTPS